MADGAGTRGELASWSRSSLGASHSYEDDDDEATLAGGDLASSLIVVLLDDDDKDSSFLRISSLM